MIPPRLLPVLARLRRLLLAPPSIEEEAQETVEIWPSETVDIPPVLMLDEDRAKVTGVHPWSTIENEWRRVKGGRVTCHPLRRHIFHNVLATPRGFFSWRAGLSQSAPVDRRALYEASIQTLGAGYYALPRTASIYFGHWLMEALPATLLKEPDEALYLPVYPDWPHTQKYVSVLDIERIPSDYVFFRTLSFCNDGWPSRSRYQRLGQIHSRLQERIPESGAAGLYISRGSTGERRMITNEDDLVRALRQRGFAIADATEPLEDIWRKGGRVPATIGVEGSQWNNALMAARRGAVHVTICPSDRFNNYNSEYMPAFDGRIATAVANKDGEGYRVDVDGVLQLLDRLAASRA